jgi:tyrosyl-tRNA synthetase
MNNMNFIEELKWRGLYYDMIPGTEKFLAGTKARGYIGFDPTAPSLGIGNMVQIIILKHFQNHGHQPIALIGGATGMIGDPSGKSEERNLLSEEQLLINQQRVKKQLEKFLDFESGNNKALLANNYDWYKDMNVLTFLRNVGKQLTVSYMMAKDSVKSRLESGISYTEFSYQLLQGYDFYYLHKYMDCRLQMGGSDQWGNLTAGVELIRRMDGEEAYAVTTPLVTKTDGTKFGKTEKGNIFLDPEMTSPYQFYQFWLNVSDDDAEKFIKIFTFLPKEIIDEAIAEHKKAPHTRHLQKLLAREVTIMVHSKEDFNAAVNASEILFGKATKEALLSISEKDFLSVFEGVPMFTADKNLFRNGVALLDVLTEKAAVFPSKSELRRTIKEGGLSINKEKISEENISLTEKDLLNNKYLLVQKGKKNYYLMVVQ